VTGKSGKSRIPELANIPFTGAKSITAYSQEARSLCRDLAIELDMGADEVYGALVASQKGHPALFGLDVRVRARRVRNRLKRASEHAQAAAVEAVKFHAQFRREFADILRPEKKKKPEFDFEDD
jgi:tRNA A37 threonylcarbamoyladenosine modification protein TsaB